MDYNVNINNFNGPLDLLLHLIKEKNIDIYDISIEEITKSYLDYINKMEQLNINVASDYLVMAAELMEIKSNSLLPQEESTSEEEPLTKETLINKLVEYKKYKEMTEVFKKLELNRSNIYIKSPENVDNYIEDTIYKEDLNIDILVNAMKNFLDRLEQERPLKTKVTNREYSIKDRKISIKNILKEKKKIEFNELFTEYNKSFISVTFLSVLELVKEKEAKINQDKNFDKILIEGV